MTRVLTIESGDRVATTTVDAYGCDAAGDEVTPAGNPQTGPFRVAGAAPGDTLAVHLGVDSPQPRPRLHQELGSAQRARSRLAHPAR